MSVLSCPSCSARYNIENPQTGKLVKCKCGTRFDSESGEAAPYAEASSEREPSCYSRLTNCATSIKYATPIVALLIFTNWMFAVQEAYSAQSTFAMRILIPLTIGSVSEILKLVIVAFTARYLILVFLDHVRNCRGPK